MGTSSTGIEKARSLFPSGGDSFSSSSSSGSWLGHHSPSSSSSALISVSSPPNFILNGHRLRSQFHRHILRKLHLPPSRSLPGLPTIEKAA
ncbi:hypothetical protein RchiOBHm_Chr7g0206881 [Rosa chinensis]|uniref:Uncharacterized protein n=1 Tax=Rosa chinensis TaxID=74649 RepID=A0A2P6P9E0_ROSCH|nr:hypothetical protein RchiOBHm_Chr7g0206881 [Rosa chinensis]